MKWVKGNVSDMIFVFMASVYFFTRDKNAEYTQIADALVVGVLLMIAGRYYLSRKRK